MSWYFDSSAILKLILREPNYAQLLPFVREQIYTSKISRVEVFRTIAVKAPWAKSGGVSFFQRCHVIELVESIINHAENYSDQITLTALDSLQVASAEAIAPLIRGIISYDKKLITNAKLLGLEAVSPGA